MRYCAFTREPGGCSCQQCGRPAGDCSDCDRCHRSCKGERDPLKIGDRTEKMLASVGITQERWQSAKALFGLAPTCKCKARKEWLNKVSDWLAQDRSQ